jgi:hypothetical protein
MSVVKTIVNFSEKVASYIYIYIYIYICVCVGGCVWIHVIKFSAFDEVTRLRFQVRQKNVSAPTCLAQFH